MKRLFLVSLLTLAAGSDPIRGEEVWYAKRLKNEVREGAGSYYPLKALLSRGLKISSLETRGDWVRFNLESITGKPGDKAWIAKNCLSERPVEKSWIDLGQRIKDTLSFHASPSSAVAGVRGFALRYGKTNESALDALSELSPPFFSPQEYEAFKEDGPDEPGPTVDLSSYTGTLAGYDVNLPEEGVGLGIAARIAARGLSRDRALLRYLNMLGTSLAEASGAYDYPFKIYVTLGKDLNALAAPGGYIFVSQALLSACRNEAELAAVLAHEMTHIVKRHGLKEIKARDVNIKADEAMDELEAAAGTSHAGPAEAELSAWGDEAYEIVNKPRTMSYEEEADQGAALILARAGYEPQAVPRMIARVADALASAPASGVENSFSRADYDGRRDKAAAFLAQAGIKGSGWTGNASRFRRFVAAAR